MGGQQGGKDFIWGAIAPLPRHWFACLLLVFLYYIYQFTLLASILAVYSNILNNMVSLSHFYFC